MMYFNVIHIIVYAKNNTTVQFICCIVLYSFVAKILYCLMKFCYSG